MQYHACIQDLQVFNHTGPAYYPVGLHSHNYTKTPQHPQAISANVEQSLSLFWAICLWMLAFVLSAVFTLSFTVFFIGLFIISLSAIYNTTFICPYRLDFLMISSFVSMVLAFIFGCALTRNTR